MPACTRHVISQSGAPALYGLYLILTDGYKKNILGNISNKNVKTSQEIIDGYMVRVPTTINRAVENYALAVSESSFIILPVTSYLFLFVGCKACSLVLCSYFSLNMTKRAW